MLACFPSQALIRRELLTNLRRGRSFLVLGLLVLACTIAVWSQWPSQHEVLNRATQVSSGLLDAIGVALLVGCALFIPGIAGSAIVSEKEQNSFDLLHVTLIRPAGIVFGKLVNALGLFFLITLGVMPVLGVVFFLVGVDWIELVLRVILILLAAFSCASVSLMCSALFRRGLVAIVASYAEMLFVFGGPWVGLYVASQVIHDLGRTMRMFRGFAVLADRFDIREHAMGLTKVTCPLVPFLDVHTTVAEGVCVGLYLTVTGLLFFFLALRFLRRPPKPAKMDARKPIDDAAILDARRRRFPYYLIDPMRRMGAIEDGRNPMLVKEIRWGMLGRMAVLIRMLYVVLLLNMLGAAACVLVFLGPDLTEAYVAAMLALIVVTCLFAPALLANTFTKEREQGNTDMLRMTLLTPNQIVLGKLGSGLVSVGPLALAAVVVALLMAAVAGGVWGELALVAIVVEGLITLLVCVGLTLAVSLISSVHARRTTTAVVASYALNLLLFGGLALAAYMVSYQLVLRHWVAIDGVSGASAIRYWARNYGIAKGSAFTPVGAFVLPYLGNSSMLTKLGAPAWWKNISVYAGVTLALFGYCLAVYRLKRMKD